MSLYVLDDFVEGWVTALTDGPVAAGTPKQFANVTNGIWYVNQENKVVPRGRRGFTALNATAIDSDVNNKIKGLHHFALGNFSQYLAHGEGTNRRFYVSADGGATWGVATGTPTFGAGVPLWTQFVSWPTRAFAIAVTMYEDEDSTATGAMYYWNGTTFTALVQTGVQMNDGPIAIYRERLAGTRSDTRGKELYFTNPDQETVVDVARTVAVNDGSGSRIMGLVADQDRLTILKERSLWYVLGDPGTTSANSLKVKYAPDGPGPTSRRSVAATPWGILYVGRQGVYLTDGVSPTPIGVTGPLRSRFRTRSSDTFFGKSVGVYIPEIQQYWLKLDPDDSLIYVLSRLDVPGDKTILIWSTHDSNITGGFPLASGAIKQRPDADAGKLMVANNKGKVYVVDTGSTDDGSVIPVSWATASLATQEHFPSAAGHFHYVDIEWRGISSIQVSVYKHEITTPIISWVIPPTANVGEIWTRSRRYNTVFDKPGTRFLVQIQNFDGSSLTSQSQEMEIRNIIIKTRPYSRRRDPTTI
jgi:hypothetical protein